MINLSRTKIVFDFSSKDSADIMQCLKTLFSTPVGTVALDRGFGIDLSALDFPIEIAKAKVSVDIINKTRKYEPRAKIEKISFENDCNNGFLIPKVVFALA